MSRSQPGAKVAKRELLREAWVARLEAHAIDPQHRDPSWAADPATAGNTNPHEALCLFYASVLGTPAPHA
jgi:hypothetical protein